MALHDNTQQQQQHPHHPPNPPWPQWPHLRALGHQRIRNQHQASNHSNPTGSWAALSGGSWPGGCPRAALIAPISQSSAPVAFSVRPHTPSCRVCGRQHDTATRRTAASPSARRMDMNRGAASPPEVVIGQQQQQTFNVYGLVRRETPCSRAVAMSRGPSEVSVGAVLRSRHIRIGHPRKRPSRFCDREKHIPT